MKIAVALWITVLVVQTNLVTTQNRTSIARVFESFRNIFDPTQPATGNPFSAGVSRLDEFTKQVVDYGIVTFTRVLSPFLQRLEQNASGNPVTDPPKPNDTQPTTTEEPRSRRDAGLFEDIVQNLEPSEEVLARAVSPDEATPGSSSKWAMRIRNYRRSATGSTEAKSAATTGQSSWSVVIASLTVTGWILMQGVVVAAKRC